MDEREDDEIYVKIFSFKVYKVYNQRQQQQRQRRYANNISPLSLSKRKNNIILIPFAILFSFSATLTQGKWANKIPAERKALTQITENRMIRW